MECVYYLKDISRYWEMMTKNTEQNIKIVGQTSTKSKSILRIDIMFYLFYKEIILSTLLNDYLMTKLR